MSEPSAQLITGPRVVLEPALADAIARHQGGDPLRPVHVLVGETLLRPYLRRRLADLMDGHLGVKFVTTGELGLLLGERTLIAACRRPLPFLADRVLAAEVMDKHDGYFEDVAAMPGFGGALFRTLRELRLAGISPNAFAKAAKKAEDPRGKLASLADIYGRYEELRAPYFAPDDGLAHADAAELGPGGLIVYGLWEPPAVLLGALASIAASATLTVLTPRTDSGADRVLDPLWAWMHEELDATRIDLDGPELGGEATALDHVRATLFASPVAGGASGDGTVRVVSAPDPAREVRDAVRVATRWAQRGVPLRDIAIVYRHADRYRGLLEDALREANLPVYLHEGTPLSERPLGRQTLAVLDLLDGDLERAVVMGFLADARLPRETWERYGGISPGRWDAISRDAGIVRGTEQWQERLGAYRLEQEQRYDEDPPSWLEDRLTSIDHLATFVADLHELLCAAPDRGSWPRHIAFLRDLLARYVDGAERLFGALDGLLALDVLPDDVPFSRAADALRALVENLRAADVLGAREGAFGVRGVQVLDVNSLRSLGYRAVVVLGVNERAFPPPPRQDSLLLDDERAALNETYGWRLPLRAFGTESESLQFAGALAATGERLQVSFPRTAGGRTSPMLPSTFARSVAAGLLGEEVGAADLDLAAHAAIVRLHSGRVTVEDPDDALSVTERLRAQLEVGDEVARAVARRRFPRLERAERAERAHWEKRFSVFDGVLSQDGAAALAKLWVLQRPFSSTALERYAGCPYRYFLSNVLGLRDRAEPEEMIRLDPLSKGGIVHSILEQFMRGRDPKATADEQRAALLAISGQELGRAEAHGLTGYSLLWRLDRAEILDDLDRWLLVELADDAPLDKHDFEVRFGPSRAGDESRGSLTQDEPLTITLPDGTSFDLLGFIDRIDWNRAGAFRVTDYKTGGMRGKDDGLAGGEALQLPLYLLAAAKALDRPHANGVARYQSVSRRGGFGEVVFNGETLDERGGEFEDLLASIVGGIRSGDFHLEPDQRNRCQYCDFNHVCDVRRDRIRQRKEHDPRAIEADRRREIK